MTAPVCRVCACGCGRPLPDGIRPHAIYLDGRHRAAAADERRGVTRRTSPAKVTEAKNKRRKQPSRVDRKPERRLSWSKAVAVVSPHVGGQADAERILAQALPKART